MTLAKELGVTKGGFYWHSNDRQALLDEMLDTWERVVIDDVIDRVEGHGGDARTRLRRLFTLASSMQDLLEIELAIRDWGRRNPAVADRLTRVDNRRMDYMRSLFGAFCPDGEDVEVRCLLAFSVFIGSHFIAADHGPRTRADVLTATLTGCSSEAHLPFRTHGLALHLHHPPYSPGSARRKPWPSRLPASAPSDGQVAKRWSRVRAPQGFRGMTSSGQAPVNRQP